MVPHHLFNETINFQVQNIQVYRMPHYSAFRILQQQKANTILSLPVWKGVLSPKGLKSWGRIDQLSGQCPWDYTHTHSHTHIIQQTQVPATRRMHDCPLPSHSQLGRRRNLFAKQGVASQESKYGSIFPPLDPETQEEKRGWRDGRGLKFWGNQSAPLLHRTLWSTWSHRQCRPKGRYVGGSDILFSVQKETCKQQPQLSSSFPPMRSGWQLTRYFRERSN